MGAPQRKAQEELGGVSSNEPRPDLAEGARVAPPGPLRLGVPEVLHELGVWRHRELTTRSV